MKKPYQIESQRAVKQFEAMVAEGNPTVQMVLPIAEFTLPYKDVFTLELPYGPPPEMRGNLNSEQQRELARLFNAPTVMHKIRLTNNSKYPLTTAPALIIRQGRVLAQGMMTYTSTGASVDLPITTAVDFQVKKSEVESKRTPNAVEENGNRYSRIDLAGKITVTSHRTKPTSWRSPAMCWAPPTAPRLTARLRR